MRSLAAILCLLAGCVGISTTLRAADPVVDAAVVALAQLTDPQRLTQLPEETFRAQLGPALGWLNVVRRRDVSPEAVIARTFARNGLAGERARLTREALLRNLARADAWELFDHAESARALSDGKPAPIPTGSHRGHYAQATVMLPEGLGLRDRREFACLVLRADDEPVPRLPTVPRHRQSGDLLAHNGAGAASHRPARHVVNLPPVTANADGDDSLPVAYTTTGNEGGRITVREEVPFGQEVPLAALGGPVCRFVLRGADEGSARFELVDGPSAGSGLSRSFTVPLAQDRPPDGGARVWRIYEQPGVLRISLYDAAPGAKTDARTVLFEFPPGQL